MRALPPGSNRKPYTIYKVLKPIDNIATSKILYRCSERLD